MDDSMVERVARALVESFNTSKNYPPPIVRRPWEQLPPSGRAYAYDQARAAIAAMREPTQKMLAAGFHDDESNRDFWISMIDAALEESNGEA